MPRLDLIIEWEPPPGEQHAFGPERATWARLSISLEGLLLTLSHPADLYAPPEEATPWVVGPMSGLVEWIADNWLCILWDIPTPFAKNASVSVQRRPVPGLRDALQGWQHFLDGDVSANRLAVWQHQHTLGHGTSDLALPSIVFMPEDRKVGIAVDHIPPALDPTVRFTAPAAADAWPSDPVWLPRDEVAASLRRFVEQTVERAASDPAAKDWAAWLTARWRTALQEADDPAKRRRLMFGEVVAASWRSVEERLGESTPALVGVLFDSPAVRDAAVLDALAQNIPTRRNATGPGFGLGEVEPTLPPHEQGYRFAARARAHLNMIDEPILDMASALGRFGLGIIPIAARQLFRSAVVSAGGESRVLYATDSPDFSGVAPTRFAVAAALGRFLSDRGASGAGVFGAAHGTHSRWLQTKLANAFAAEFLLPVQAMRKRGPNSDLLCDEYGISRSAATWHTRNRFAVEMGRAFGQD